jgi:hypothetical protein
LAISTRRRNLDGRPFSALLTRVIESDGMSICSRSPARFEQVAKRLHLQGRGRGGGVRERWQFGVTTIDRRFLADFHHLPEACGSRRIDDLGSSRVSSKTAFVALSED